MAFDGLVISNIVDELNTKLSDGRINKINQPEADELIFVVKSNKEQYKLLLSANASLPLTYITTETKQNPLTAPNFCMLLRKHISGGRIISVTQPNFERIIDFEIEHLNELGDLCTKHLIVELMGKHSNIIFCDNEKMIIDSIKHISGFVSSVREVLPGKPYFIAETSHKLNPLDISFDTFKAALSEKNMPIFKAIYSSITGISPLIANELCYRASLESTTLTSDVNDMYWQHLYGVFDNFIDDVKQHAFLPNMIYDNDEPIEYSSTNLSCFEGKNVKEYSSISELLQDYYSLKSAISRIKQKSFDIRKVLSNAIERTSKKYDLQLKQMKDTEKKDKYKVYGELINTYGYSLTGGEKSMTALNYYTNEEITIPLDPQLSALDNAKKYFDKYNKLKRTYEALETQLVETKSELEHLESINAALDIAILENDLADIKREMMDYGYIRRKVDKKNKNPNKKPKKEKQVKTKPLHYISSDGYHIYVGKNNYQNDELTFKFAVGNDWWFHAKGMAGSHVVVKTNGEELPDRTFEEAASLAAYYSKAKDMEKVEIDYTEKKNVKKPNGSKPGFVVYYTNYSMIVKPDISNLKEA